MYNVTVSDLDIIVERPSNGSDSFPFPVRYRHLANTLMVLKEDAAGALVERPSNGMK